MGVKVQGVMGTVLEAALCQGAEGMWLPRQGSRPTGHRGVGGDTAACLGPPASARSALQRAGDRSHGTAQSLAQYYGATELFCDTGNWAPGPPYAQARGGFTSRETCPPALTGLVSLGGQCSLQAI